MLHFKRTKRVMSLAIVSCILALNFNVASAITWGWRTYEPSVRIYYEGSYCDIQIFNGISDDKHFSEASTTVSTNNLSINHSGSVSATFYVLDTSTHSTYSFGYGAGGENGGGVSATRTGSEKIYEVISDHTATYGTSTFTRNDLISDAS